jgi:uncharacterized protein (TIGR04255 family)
VALIGVNGEPLAPTAPAVARSPDRQSFHGREDCSGIAEKETTMPTDAGTGTARHYARAPIIEASIILEIGHLAGGSAELLPRVGECLGQDYPNAQDLADFLVARRETKPDASGVVYSSEDGRQIVQARSDRFQFTRQAPYDRWETFLTQGQRAWTCYKDVLGAIEVRRLVVKYVNIIQIPIGVPLRELFNTYPALPLPDQLLNDMQMRYSLTLEGGLHGHLTVFMVFLNPSPDRSSGRMALDNTFSFPVEDEAKMWDEMPRIRQIKNETFESQITDRLRETFQ